MVDPVFGVIITLGSYLSLFFRNILGFYFNIVPEALSFVFYFLNDQSTKLIKHFLTQNLWDITRRPEGAYNTDYFSRNGPAKKDAPGFPSRTYGWYHFFLFVYVTSEKRRNGLGELSYMKILP